MDRKAEYCGMDAVVLVYIDQRIKLGCSETALRLRGRVRFGCPSRGCSPLIGLQS